MYIHIYIHIYLHIRIFTIPPFFKNAGRGKERIWGEEIATPQPTDINWAGLDEKEKLDLIPTLAATDNWILLTHHCFWQAL